MQNIKNAKVLQILHITEDITIMCVLVILMIMTITNVVLRYVFLTGLLWSEEFIGFNLLVVGTIGAAACVRDKLHTSLDGIVCKFPLKVQNISYFFVNILVIIVLGYFTYGGMLFVKTVGLQQSFILNWPMKIFYIMIPIGCFLCLVEQIINMIDDIIHRECRFKTIEEQIAEEETE